MTAKRDSIPRPSIENPLPEYHMQPITPQNEHRYFRSSTSTGHTYFAQTPEWQRPPVRLYTPTIHTNPWNIGIPGSENEHVMMDMRATAPFEGWPHESQSPEPTKRDGTQNDGLDDFMDRRSCYSATPAAPHLHKRSSVIYEECEMEN